ncbi:DUF6308 family protein [Arthrobacter sp. SX1312]|uniref:DUF6308 family protein n=1 Tax=Arthrobacter sp. SX1312 TaxID=2058896 RepID=UPI000CE5362C|nr:DUF6308 family protein [Arthrobacter sp. SX1312]
MTHPILNASHVNEAVELVKQYYGPLKDTGRPRSGAHFDEWAGGGYRAEAANELTGDDFVAVSMLSVDVPPEAAIGLAGHRTGDVRRLLGQIPASLDFTTLTPTQFDAHLGPDSPAQQLWDILRGRQDYPWGIGPTTASKIMARKRPKLVPVFDSYIGPMMGLPKNSSADQWTVWHQAFQEDPRLASRLDAIRLAAGAPPSASRLRIMDIVLWLHAKDQEWSLKDRPAVDTGPALVTP